MWKCTNPSCDNPKQDKTFPIPAQIAVEEKPKEFTSNATRIVVTYAACPYCRSKEIEEVKS
jgi:hypothetical protein